MKSIRYKLNKYLKKNAVYIRDIFASFLTLIISNIKICRANYGPSANQITFLRRPLEKEKIDHRLVNLLRNLLINYLNDEPISIEIAQKNPILNSSWNKELFSINGEHYFLIELLCKELKPKSVIEIGTYYGAAAAVCLSNENIEKYYSFDLVKWESISHSYLLNISRKIIKRKFTQFLDNLFLDSNFVKYKDIFINSDLIIIDVPKDNKFEKKIIYYLLNTKPTKPIYVLMDDIYLSTMVDLWNEIPFKKIDISFIGHWSGSGLFIWE